MKTWCPFTSDVAVCKEWCGLYMKEAKMCAIKYYAMSHAPTGGQTARTNTERRCYKCIHDSVCNKGVAYPCAYYLAVGEDNEK